MQQIYVDVSLCNFYYFYTFFIILYVELISVQKLYIPWDVCSSAWIWQFILPNKPKVLPSMADNSFINLRTLSWLIFKTTAAILIETWWLPYPKHNSRILGWVAARWCAHILLKNYSLVISFLLDCLIKHFSYIF